jgi:hypothetical protein
MKPESLRKVGSKGQAGFDVEKRISDNLGTEAAGSSAVGFDFHWADKDGKKVVRGKTKIVETVKSGKAVKGKDAPDVRGESKLSKGKFGQSVVSYQDGKWGFRNSSKMNSAFEKSNVVGPDGKTRTILEHLNKYHKDGKISKGFTARAAAGTARQYLSSSDINTLHVHHREKDKKTGKITIDRGTTYTIGNTSLKGKTNLGHLSEEDIGRLDGSVNVQASGTGRAEVTHRPSQSIMKELAGNAHGDKAHMHGDLSNAGHASQFVEHVKKHIAKSKKVKR